MDLDKRERRNGRTEPAYWNDAKLSIPSRPVVGVTWQEATAYCAWLNERLCDSEELPDGYVVRLPTEAEWEKTARGVDGRPWPWGSSWEENHANTYETNLLTTTSVGILPVGASPWGAPIWLAIRKTGATVLWQHIPTIPGMGEKMWNLAECERCVEE